eukprot:5102523-Amphidinium_carterae.1
MLKDLKDEENAALRSTEVASEANATAVLTPQDQTPTLDDPLETGTVAEDLPPVECSWYTYPQSPYQ